MSNWSSLSDKARKGLFKIKNAGKHVPTAQNEDLSAAAMVYRTAHTLHSADNRTEEGTQSSIVYTIQDEGV